MTPALSLYRAHSEVVSFYLEAEALRDALHRYRTALAYFPDDVEKLSKGLLEDVHQSSKASADFMQLNNEDAFWLFRRAHAQMFPGKLLRKAYASYHDLAYWEAENFIAAIQTSNNDAKTALQYSILAEWPTALNPEGIKVALAETQHAFDDIMAIQGYLKLEAAAAANIAPSMAIDTPPDAGESEEDLTPRERNIMEAIGKEAMQAKELAKKAGYDCTSNFRSTLSGLVKRRHLKKCPDGFGYIRAS